MPIEPDREKSVFLAAADIPDPAARAAFLDGACAGDAELRDRVEALLRADADAADLPPGAPSTATFGGAAPLLTAEFPGRHEHAGAVIGGKYTLVEPIGAGGMGAVWRARQTEPVKRFVAVKLIKQGMDSRQVLARFEAERQALALMDHPHIAKVLDGGVHEGRPFFVMELVKGVPVTEYCDHHKLTPRQRLELFVPVCQAIQHAHQKGVIHRDIKPSNVLVALYDDRAVPKVIDFGVAKATGGTLTEHTIDTGFGGVVGTPQYMSPEQATFNNLDIDTRSDVYALGVLLYELLAGSPPFSRKELEQKGVLEILRVIREEEPPRPSTKLSTADALPTLSANRGTEPKKLTGLLRSELDWIVMKALEKDRTRRYETANGFAADVLRYLAGEPVLAHPPSAGYRLKKFVRRNRVQVVAAGVVLMALVVGVIGTALGLVEARRQEANARANEDEAKRQEQIARDNETEARRQAGIARGETAAKEKALQAETAAKRDEQQANVDLWNGLDQMTANIVGASLATQTVVTDEQKKFLTTVLPLYQKLAAKAGNDRATRARVAGAALRVGLIESRVGRKGEGADAFRQARDEFEKLASEFPAVPDYRADLAVSHHSLGLLLSDLGQRVAAREQFRAALELQEKLVAEFPAVRDYRQTLSVSHLNLGILLSQMGQQVEADEQYRKALESWEKLAAEFPTFSDYRRGAAVSHYNLGLLLAGQGQGAEAVEQHRKALALHEKLAAEFPTVPEHRQGLALTRADLANLLRNLGQQAEAEEQFHKAMGLQEKLVAEFPADPNYRAGLAVSHTNLGLLLFGLSRWAEAEEQFRKALGLEEKLATEFPAVPVYRKGLAGSHTNLGNILAGLGQRSEAEEQFRKALELQERLVAEFPAVPVYRQDLAKSHHSLGNVLSNLSQRAAEEQYRKALELHEKLVAEYPAVPEYRQDLAKSHNSLGNLLMHQGQLPEAEEHYRKGLGLQEKLVAEFPTIPAYRRDLSKSHNSLGNLQSQLGQGVEAEKHYRKALGLEERLAAEFPTLPDYRHGVAVSHTSLGSLLMHLGKRKEAEDQYRKGLELREKLATEFPAVSEYRVQLGGNYCNLGTLVRDGGQPADSLGLFDKAIETLGTVARAEPRNVTARLFLRNSYWGRAVAHDRLKKYAEALKDWDQAIELSPKLEQLQLRAARATSRVNAGQVAEAVAEVAELRKQFGWNAGQLYNFARVYSIASAQVADKKQEFAEAAMELLQKAVRFGWKDHVHITKDTDLDPLRARDDFQKLVAALEAKFPALELAPPPHEKK
jgi:eukaryotic-like serine/threonine-protein kinase